MGMCHSFRSRLSQSAISYTNPGNDVEPGHSDSCDPQLRERRRVEERARVKAENKRSRDIDITLKAEKRQYKQTHRLLLLGKSRVSRMGRLLYLLSGYMREATSRCIRRKVCDWPLKTRCHGNRCFHVNTVVVF
ncbi:hypothetical protein QQF64_028273 [Cirrhinus molitorella]|uniref:Uncharacterized protein n=1 Tax=Cirrhinus molitorella TaxID=172907 RepID=A0ABR3N692_9TELE